jgi:hypothetical protein
MIYDHVFDDMLPSLNPLAHSLRRSLTGDLEEAIFHVNQATRIDAGLCYLRTQRFEIWNNAARNLFENYLDRFPGEQGYEAVGRLVFPKFYFDVVKEGERYPNIKLMLRCKNLRIVILTFSRFILERHIENTGAFGPLMPSTLDQVIAQYELGGIFGLQKLKKVELRLFRRRRPLDHVSALLGCSNLEGGLRGRNAEVLMKELRDWLFVGFSKVGRMVEVKFVHP